MTGAPFPLGFLRVLAWSSKLSVCAPAYPRCPPFGCFMAILAKRGQNLKEWSCLSRRLPMKPYSGRPAIDWKISTKWWRQIPCTLPAEYYSRQVSIEWGIFVQKYPWSDRSSRCSSECEECLGKVPSKKQLVSAPQGSILYSGWRWTAKELLGPCNLAPAQGHSSMCWLWNHRLGIFHSIRIHRLHLSWHQGFWKFC